MRPAPPGRVLAALVRSGLVDAATACEREVSLRDASRSNPVHVTVVDGTPTLVVKQAGPPVDTGSSLAAEAAAYAWLAGEPDLRAIAPTTAAPPREADWLVLEAVPDSRPVSELLGTPELELDAVVVGIAGMLGRLHSLSARNDRAAETL